MAHPQLVIDPPDPAARDLPDRAWFPFVVGFPLLLLLVHRDLGHFGDIGFFREWCAAVAAGPGFYADGPGVNYPILGVFFVCAPSRLDPDVLADPDAFRHALKASLAVAEMGLLLVTAALARTLGARRPRWLAVGVALLPSSWAAGAWFGQIDVWGTLLLLAAVWGVARWALDGSRAALLLGWLAVHGAILTKQLLWISMPMFGLLLLAALRARPPRWRLALVAVVAVVPLYVVPELFLELPDGWSHHLPFILAGGGSAHGDVLTANGANIWAWAVDTDTTSARELRLAGLSAWLWGWGVFAAVHVLVLGWLISLRGRDRGEVVRAGVLALGVVNLTMAVWLTGVHERYLVHGVPLLLLALGTGAARARGVVVGAWFVGGWSGLFVLSSIHFDRFTGPLLPFRSHTLTGMLELALWVTLVAVIVVGVARRRPPRSGAA